MSDRKHHVRRAVFDLATTDQATSFELRKKLEEQYERLLLPCLEEVFDELSNGTPLRLDRVEIDLGSLDPDHWNQEELRHAIREQLLRHLDTSPVQSTWPAAQARSSAQSFLRFLRVGQMPWHSEFESLSELEQELVSLSSSQVRAMLPELQQTLRAADPRNRLAWQFSGKLLAWILAQFVRGSSESILERVSSLTMSQEHVQVKRLLIQRLVEYSTLEAQEDVQRAFSSILEQRPPVRPKPAATTKAPASTTTRTDQDSVVASSDIEVHNQETKVPQSSEGLDEESIRVPFAGIVLLHPFLPKFFKALHLLDENTEFRSVSANAEAIHILHYCATGQENPEEQQLVLLKLLVGWRQHQPLMQQFSIRDDAKQESAALLSQVIHHWATLKNTSIEALRETFLDRPGSLVREEQGWRLTVEQKPFDMLLDHLPWNISMLRTPWMSELLSVDWA